MAFNFSPRMVTDGLIWGIDVANSKSYTSGSLSIFSVTTNAISGSINNGITYDNSNVGILSFDGTDDFIQATNNGFFNTQDTTWGFWFYRTRSANEVLMSSEDGISTNRNGYGFRNRSNGFVWWTIAYYGNGDTLSAAVPSNPSWYYLTGIKSSTVIKLYLNGVPKSQGTTNRTIDSQYPLSIGRILPTGPSPEFFSGSLAAAHVYNRALSDSEVLQNYNALKGRFGL